MERCYTAFESCVRAGLEGIRMEGSCRGSICRSSIDEGFYSESVSLKVLERKEPVTILQKVKMEKKLSRQELLYLRTGKLFEL